MAADLLAMQLPLAGLFWHKLRGIKGHIGNGPQADEVLFKELLQLTEQLAPGFDAVGLERHLAVAFCGGALMMLLSDWTGPLPEAAVRPLLSRGQSTSIMT